MVRSILCGGGEGTPPSFCKRLGQSTLGKRREGLRPPSLASLLVCVSAYHTALRRKRRVGRRQRGIRVSVPEFLLLRRHAIRARCAHAAACSVGTRVPVIDIPCVLQLWRSPHRPVNFWPVSQLVVMAPADTRIHGAACALYATPEPTCTDSMVIQDTLKGACIGGTRQGREHSPG